MEGEEGRESQPRLEELCQMEGLREGGQAALRQSGETLSIVFWTSCLSRTEGLS